MEIRHTFLGGATILNWLPKVARFYPENIIFEKIEKTVIYIDGKEIKVKGKRKSILIATSKKLRKPIFYKIYDGENKGSSEDFLRKLNFLYGNNISGIVSDFGRGRCFVKPSKMIFPKTPHQICIVHFLRHMNMFIPKTKKSKFYWQKIWSLPKRI